MFSGPVGLHDGDMPPDFVATSVPAAPPAAGTAFIATHDLNRVCKGGSVQFDVAGVDPTIRCVELGAPCAGRHWSLRRSEARGATLWR